MNFGHRLAVVLANDIEHFVHRKCPSVRVAALLDEAGVRAKLAVIDAQIRRLDVEVAVEKSVVAVLFFSDKIGKCADVRKSAVFKEKNTFVEFNALVVSNCLGDAAMVGAEVLVVQEGVELFNAAHFLFMFATKNPASGALFSIFNFF